MTLCGLLCAGIAAFECIHDVQNNPNSVYLSRSEPKFSFWIASGFRCPSFAESDDFNVGGNRDGASPCLPKFSLLDGRRFQSISLISEPSPWHRPFDS
jgi:hypothetical protein